MWPARRVLKYCFCGVATLGAASFHESNYDLDSVAAVRVGRAAVTVFRIAVHYRTNLYGSDLDPESDKYLELKSKTHSEAAEKLLSLCRSNKGVFVKVGQHIGALEFLVPTEYVNTMKVLHSQAPCSPLKGVFNIIRDELKQEPEELFIEFASEPLGAASLAQVHKAKLKDGRIVAVKVQHPYVMKNSILDMKIMEVLVNIVAWAFPDFQFQWLVEETKKNLPRELDFKQEAANTTKVRRMFKHLPWLKIPRVYDDLSTSRILTMEFIEGGQVNDLAYMNTHRIDPFDVSDKLGLLYSEMIFQRGFVHSDPHPGNILVKRLPQGKAEIILLDHGLYAEISDKVRVNYSGLWLSILNRNKEGMKVHSEALGVGSLFDLFSCMVSGRTWNAINAGIDKSYGGVSEKEEFQKDIPKVLPYIIKTLALVNRELLLILKTNDLLRGIEFTLKTQHRQSSYLVMSKFCVCCVYDNRIKMCSNNLMVVKHFLSKQWSLFKLSLYYFYLSSRTFSFKKFFRNILY